MGLRIWEETDPFLMEEMNDANRKIDAAIAERPVILLAEKKLEASAYSVYLDLSEKDLADVIELQVFFPGENNTRLRLNSFSGTLYSYSSSQGWQLSGSSTVSAPDGHVSVRNIRGLGSAEGDIYMEGFSKYKISASSVGPLHSLTFTRSSPFAAGDRFIVIGIKV